QHGYTWYRGQCRMSRRSTTIMFLSMFFLITGVALREQRFEGGHLLHVQVRSKGSDEKADPGLASVTYWYAEGQGPFTRRRGCRRTRTSMPGTSRSHIFGNFQLLGGGKWGDSHAVLHESGAGWLMRLFNFGGRAAGSVAQHAWDHSGYAWMTSSKRPRTVKKRTQLRAESGRLLEPAEEDWPAIGPCMHFSRDEIQGCGETSCRLRCRGCGNIVREKAKAQGRSLYELRAGIPRRGRHLLEEDGHTESYDSVRGIRQAKHWAFSNPTLHCGRSCTRPKTVTFQRLRKFLMAKRTVSFKRRLDRRGYDLIRIQMTKQDWHTESLAAPSATYAGRG
ncbi:unnamed protein product, partial [Symbiodinium sp. KB8]